jgi:fatty acid desaturase
MRQPYRRGYQAVPGMREVVGAAHRTRLWLTVSVGVFDHLFIPGAALASAWMSLWSLPAGIALGLVAAVFCGRQLRALECLVHEACHFNWSRHHRKANDRFAAVLAGWPTGLGIESYRRAHLVHHGRFGSDEDPDRQRYEELGIEGLDRSGSIVFAKGMLPRLVAYQRGWLRATAAEPLTLGMLVLWALCAVVAPAVLIWPGTHAVVLSSSVWAIGYLLALPVIRFIGESSEHSYTDADTVFDSTITNLGRVQRWVIHPHSDGYHTVHHLWPSTPHHGLRQLHLALTDADPESYATRLRVRTRVLSTPSPNRATPLPSTRRESVAWLSKSSR